VIKEVKEFLSQNFEMEHLGEAGIILNIKLVRESNGEVTLSQSHFVKKVVISDIVTVKLSQHLTMPV